MTPLLAAAQGKRLKDMNMVNGRSLINGTSLFWLICIWYLLVVLVAGGLQIVALEWAIDPTLIVIAQFAPIIGVLGVMVFARLQSPQRLFIRSLLPETTNRAHMSRRLVIGIGVTLAYGLMVVGAAWAGQAFRSELPFGSISVFALFLVLQTLGSIGEEVGWRGFLQPALETTMHRLWACILIGILWAAWHVQNMAEPLTAILFILSCIGFSIMFGYIAVGNIWQRGLIAGVMHAIVNIVLFLAFDPESALVGSLPLSLLFLIPFGAGLMWMRKRPIQLEPSSAPTGVRARAW